MTMPVIMHPIIAANTIILTTPFHEMLHLIAFSNLKSKFRNCLGDYEATKHLINVL